MDHRNLQYHTALQAVHQTRKKSRDGFIQTDNVVTVCLVKVFMHSPSMAYVRSPSLIG